MKKAQMESSLVKIILVIVVFVIMILVLIYMFFFAKNETDREICTFSLQAAASSKLLGEPLFHVDCKRQEVIIKEADVKGDSNKVENEKVFEILRNEIYSCYSMIPPSLVNKEYPFREGKDPWTRWQYENNICLICSTIKFDGELSKKDWTGFNRWLLENPVPEEHKNIKNLIYNTALTEEDFKLADILDQNPIKGTDTYVVVVQWRAEGVFKKMTTGLSQGLAASMGPVLGPLLGIPLMIKQARSIQCAYVTDKDSTECDPKYPVFALMNINDLGEEMGNVDVNKITVGTETWEPSKAFCSVLWN